MIPLDDFAMLLKKLRTESNLTLEDLSAKTGITTISLKEYEMGKRRPNDEKVVKMAEALGVDPKILFYEI